MMPSFVQENAPLAKYMSNRTGGEARYFAEPSSEDEVKELFAWIKQEQLQWFPLGGGANTLVCSDGFDGVVVHLAMKELEINGTTVRVDAGLQWPVVGLKAAKAGLSGLEFATVIPGSVGGAIYGNAGAYEQETKDRLVSVRYFDVETGEILEKTRDELGFAYRHSAFKEHAWLILSATFELEEDNQLDIDTRIAEYRAHRESTQPLSQPSTGCVFKNPEGDHAGRLIDEAGLKGYRVGDAMVSDVHANFIVNLGEATAEDVKAVREHVKKTILEKFAIQLEEENILLGE